ncbi:MAG: NlpC/P60 family protein [Bacteroidetes bacterium]|nr:MAG: NlpC/P60 family protein [Bacteroidota bacterium]
MMRLNLFIFIFLLVLSSSCSHLRNTPSYREEGRDRFGPSPAREPSTAAAPRYANLPAADAAFYASKSRKLGYTLNGNENPALLTEIVRWLGTPYQFGGTTPNGVDCSGLAQVVYRRVYDIDLERVTVNMAQRTRRVNQRNLREGDLIFFKINNRNVSHVGIYISNNKFVHASTSRGVIINDLDEAYYKRNFAFGGRVRK